VDGAEVKLVNGFSKRGNPSPKLHALPVPLLTADGQYLTLCGRKVVNATTVTWDPEGIGNRCAACVEFSEGTGEAATA